MTQNFWLQYLRGVAAQFSPTIEIGSQNHDEFHCLAEKGEHHSICEKNFTGS